MPKDSKDEHFGRIDSMTIGQRGALTSPAYSSDFHDKDLTEGSDVGKNDIGQ